MVGDGPARMGLSQTRVYVNSIAVHDEALAADRELSRRGSSLLLHLDRLAAARERVLASLAPWGGIAKW